MHAPTSPETASLRGGARPLGSAASPTDALLRELVRRAGEEILRHFRVARGESKPDGTFVTAADRAAEAILVSGLRAAFPDDSVISEEGGGHLGTSGRRWFVDPLDGTGAFLEGLPTWSVTLARLAADGEVEHGVVWMPRADTYAYVERGLGAFRDGSRLTRFGEGSLNREAILYVPSRLHAFARLRWPGKARCVGSTAVHLAMVAGGGAEAALIGPGWQPWDIAAGVALIEAVGGVVQGFDGQPLNRGEAGGGAFVAGTAEAVRWLQTPGHLRPFGPAT